jgi:predicted alpha/beta superfamily hydrolase
MRQTVAVAVLFTGWLGHVEAQTRPAEVAIPQTEYRTFTSSLNGRHYSVAVALPSDYARNQTKRYPVLYFTDPQLHFGILTDAYRLLRISREVDELILVGVGSEDFGGSAAARRADLTPTRNREAEAAYAQRFGGGFRIGGAPEFLRVFTEEIIPETDRRYRTTDARGCFGASLGGLFGAYALLHRPETFGRLALASPSLDWDDGVLFKDEEQFSKDHKELRVTLFMSAGELETPQMLGNMRRFVTVLSERRYGGLALHSRIFEAETHSSQAGVAIFRSLCLLFPPN